MRVGPEPATLNSCALVHTRDLLFSGPNIEYFVDGKLAKAKFLFPKYQNSSHFI